MKRPGTVIAAGIVAIAASLAALCGTVVHLPLFAPDAAGSTPGPMIQAYRDHPALLAYVRVETVAGLIVAFALVGAAVGLLLLAPWGRRLGLVCAVYAIVTGAANAVLAVMYVAPAFASRGAGGGSAAFQGGQRAGTAIGAALGPCITEALAIALFVLLTRPSVREALRRPG